MNNINVKKLLIQSILTDNNENYANVCKIHNIGIGQSFTITLNKLQQNSIHIACIHNKLQFLEFSWQYLFDSPSVFSIRDTCYKEPIHQACQHGNIECIEWLIKYIDHLQINSLKKADWTPLMLAVVCKGVASDVFLEIVQTLIDKNSDLHIQNRDGWTAFHLACRTGDLAVVELLGEADSRTCVIPSKNGRTPLHTAALHGNADIVKFLVKNHYPSVDIVDSCGMSPILDCLIGGHVDTAKWLIENCDVNLNRCDRLGRGAIAVACESGQLESVKFLLELCPSLIENRAPGDGRTPLLSAARIKSHSLIDYLINVGANVSATDNQGRSLSDFIGRSSQICQ